MSIPDLSYEIAQGRDQGLIVCGVDEVGRGPLAGPVIACAAIIPAAGLPETIANQIRDSKQLSARQRGILYPTLTALCPYALGEASVAEIDRINILQASILAMQRAVAGLSLKPARILVDGNRAPHFSCPATAIVKGDCLSLSIAAASIIAKVTRDRLMQVLDADYPGYGWATNAGYGTAAHLRAMAHQGITPHHRASFAPVAQLSLRTA